MAVDVYARGTTQVQRVTSTGTTTVVKQVKVGVPVRRVSGGNPVKLDRLADVDTNGAENGSVLVYNGTTWLATRTLERQTINGGNF